VLNAHLKQELVPPDHLNTSLSSGLGEVVEFMMTKDAERRYQSPEDLILDLECLLNRKPPKLARERISTGTLAALAHGATDAADLEPEEESPKQVPWIWFALSAALLAVSLLLNLLLVLLRH